MLDFVIAITISVALFCWERDHVQEIKWRGEERDRARAYARGWRGPHAGYDDSEE